ncbi:MAG: T9SS type A sorting domain-containing protein [Flavobacteriales bacterium]
MKHIYVTLLAVLIGSTVGAQGLLPAMKTKEAQLRRVEAANTNAQAPAERETIWTNDFSNCDDWSIDDAFSNGYTEYVEGLNFECGIGLEPTGFAPIAALNSTTAGNGFMMVDSDLFGGEEGGTGIENNWFQSVNPIDCSNYPYVSVMFETFYRMWDGGSSDGNEYCLVEVSRDGVTWPDITTYEVAEGFVDFGDGDGEVQARWEVWPNMATQDPVSNPTIITFDISAIAGNQSQIWLRFRWKGTWGYAWMIDDVEVFETPANDIRTDTYVSYSDYETTFAYEYGAWPESQLAPFNFAATCYNAGYNDQSGVLMNVTVNGEDAGSSDAIDLPYQALDTMRANGWELTSGLGEYEVVYTMTMDSEDENPGNNTLSQSFEVTDYSWGRDDGSFTGVFPFDGSDDFIALNPFDVYNDVTIYAIDVAIADDSDEGTPVIAHLFDGTDDTFITDQYGGLLVSSDELDLAASYSNSGNEEDIVWYTLVLNEPYEAAAGDFIAAGFEHYGGSNVQIWESKYTYNSTSFVYGPFGAGDAYDWYYTNEVPMVRLNLNPNATNTVNVGNIVTQNFELFTAVPNPAIESTRVQYRLDQASEIAIEVRDMMGKLVVAEDRGTLSAGYHSLTLDVSAWEAGVYTFILNVDGARATQRMIVQ